MFETAQSIKLMDITHTTDCLDTSHVFQWVFLDQSSKADHLTLYDQQLFKWLEVLKQA